MTKKACTIIGTITLVIQAFIFPPLDGLKAIKIYDLKSDQQMTRKKIVILLEGF